MHLFTKRTRNKNLTACGFEDKSFAAMTAIVSMVTCRDCISSDAYRKAVAAPKKWMAGAKADA